jgi:hypothetical protein
LQQYSATVKPEMENEPLNPKSPLPLRKPNEELPTLMAKDPFMTSKVVVEKEQQKAMKDITRIPDHQDAGSYKVLVEEVFRPQPILPKSPVVEETSYLPRLLSRAMWAPVEPPANINREIQALRTKQIAASQLLDAIEHEAESIEQRLVEREGEKRRQAQEKQSKGFFALPLTACLSCSDRTEDEEDEDNLKQPMVLRPALLKQLTESQQELVERDSEIHRIKHELDLLRKGHLAQHEAVRQGEKDKLLEPTHNKKEALLRRYSTSMSKSQDLQMQIVLSTWKTYARQRVMRSRMLKRGSLAFAAAESQRLGLMFSTWNALVIEKKKAQVLTQNTRQKAMRESYAAKLLTQVASTTLRATFAGWWRCSKESALQARLAGLEAMQTERKVEPQLPVGTKDKACCVLM